MRTWMARLALSTIGLTAAWPVMAQETTATITGVVTDDTGGALPGATVTVKETRTGRVLEFVTTETGSFTATLLPIGEYEVTFNLSGFQVQTVTGIRLSVNDRVTINGKLAVGGVAETIEVTAGTTLVQQTPALQSLVGSRQVQELPLNNRNFVQLATLAPGVSSDLVDEVGVGLTSLVSLSVNGARRNAVNWNVDGVSNVDVGSNITLLSTPTLESIEEFKLLTSSYTAEWPRSGGGVVNVVTKSGTNQFRGSAYEFFRNDALNANNWFRKQSTDPVTRKAPMLRYNNFGYTIGGPIVREKAFFFWSEEWRRIQRAPGSIIANVPNPNWLTDPTSANYVAPALRDANAVALLAAYPAPNLPQLTPDGPGRYANSVPNINNTRQEVFRGDYDLSRNWKITGRYTQDLSETREGRGLFLTTDVPNVATTETAVPGKVFAATVKTIMGGSRLNELSVQRSGNRISSETPDGTRNRRSDYGINIPEIFPENADNIIPYLSITGLSDVRANQLINIEYVNWTVTDNFSWQRGDHAFKFGGLGSWEQKNENAASVTQGNFTFATTANGPSSFQSFLSGNRAGACSACAYTEAERDITMNLRFSRFEFYAQDSWRLKPHFTLDYGVRYSLYPPVTDANNQLVTFDPAAYDASRAPRFANAIGTFIDPTTGDLLVGIIQGGVNSPFGDGIYAFVKDSIQPRIGFAWDVSRTGATVLRGAYGIYYDQPLVGIFEQNSFTTPPIVSNVTLNNIQLSNPAAGTSPTTSGVRTISSTATDFKNPRTQQWNATVTHRVLSKGVVEVSYVGARGDNLIRPTNLNFAQPADVVALQSTVAGAVNPARPFRSYGVITHRETTAINRYNGLLTSFRYEGGRTGTATLNYTLSRNQTDSTNDRDAIDIPQNPADPGADYADARTDRRHIFTASYVYELPFFAESTNGFAKAALGGWQLAGIVYMNSGQPMPRILVLDNNGRRGVFPDEVGDPQAGEGDVKGTQYWFNPAAFMPPADGTFGNSGRAPFRQPGYHKWDVTLSKNFYLFGETRMQFRADFINVFNQVNWNADPLSNGLDNTCTNAVDLSTCVSTADPTFGRVLQARAAREIQLGIKLYW